MYIVLQPFIFKEKQYAQNEILDDLSDWTEKDLENACRGDALLKEVVIETVEDSDGIEE